MTTDEHRIIDLEVRSAYQEKRVTELDEALVEQARRIDALEETIALLKEALRRVRSESQGAPVAGALPEEDPVPRSG